MMNREIAGTTVKGEKTFIADLFLKNLFSFF